MSAAAVLEVVAPAFLLIALGVVAGGFLRLDVRSLTDAVVYLAAPALIFDALVAGELVAGEMLLLAAGAATIVVGVGCIFYLVTRLFGWAGHGLYLPVMFMNAGNMLLPLSLLAFGEEGLRRSVVIFVTVAVLQASLGVAIARGRPSPMEMFRLPYVYAVACAFAVRGGWLDVWQPLGEALSLLGDMAVPAMLLALGARLRTVRPDAWLRPSLAAAVRLGGGYTVAVAFVYAFGIEGVARQCLILAGTMPSAVVNFVFAEKYASDAGDVATTIVASTVASIVTTPLVLTYGM